MAVFLVWIDDTASVPAVTSAPGPWREARPVAPGLVLLESDETLSSVYHQVKWLLPDHAALLVAPLSARPKARGLSRGAVAWLRARLSLPDATV